MNYSEIVKKLRLFFKLTQKEFAEKTGLSIATIQGYEQGKYEPKITTMFKIIASFGSEIEECRYPFADHDLSMEIAYLTGAFAAYQRDASAHKSQTSSQLNNPVKILLNHYEQLNDSGKAEAVKRISELTRLEEYAKPAPPKSTGSDASPLMSDQTAAETPEDGDLDHK